MIRHRFQRRILKIAAYFFGGLLVLLTAFHFWFINHAEDLLEDLVASQSNGKVRLKVKKFRFNWFSNDMHLRNAVFYSTDTSASTAYRFAVDRIDIRVREIFPLIFQHRFNFDSLSLLNPDIEVTRVKRSKDTDTADTRRVSLPQEMGKIYKSIQDALQVLRVRSFRIQNARFTLANQMEPSEQPVTIDRIQLHLDNLQIDTNTAAGHQKILFSDNVTLSTDHQNIVFPDGRHRLSFANFNINIRNRLVEFDSCTISATKGDSSKSSFRIFFDKLQLTDINFDSLYQKEIIKADSVYCINPQFSLNVELEKRTGKFRPPPKLNELIQQLTGDLEVGFVVVQDGSFDINTLREGRPSSFTSNHNNFELRGLRINEKAERPLTVEGFAMAIRNYENFLRDSTYALRFDSVLLNTNGIYLSNFSLKQMLGDKVLNSFDMPQFVLNGFSWDDLVFDQKLSAKGATLYSPRISYSFREKSNGRERQDLFQTLAGIGDVIQLGDLDILNGEIVVNFRDKSRLELRNASMSLKSQQIIRSRKVATLQRSVDHLRFEKGSLKSRKLLATMENVDFSGGDGRLVAGKMHITSVSGNLDVLAKNVAIRNMEMDNRSQLAEINGIQWKEADVKITGSGGQKDMMPDFIIRGVVGHNTRVQYQDPSTRLSVRLDQLVAGEIQPRKDQRSLIRDLQASGRDLSLEKSALSLQVDKFSLTDQGLSKLEDVKWRSITKGDSIQAAIPVVSIRADMNQVLAGTLEAESINVENPRIRISGRSAALEEPPRTLPAVAIGRLEITQPDIIFDRPGSHGISHLEWRGKKESQNRISLSGFRIRNDSSIQAAELTLGLRNFALITGSKSFDAGEGSIQATIQGFRMLPNDLGNWDWQGTIRQLSASNFILDSLGNGGRLHIRSARLGNLTAGTNSLLNLTRLVRENLAFRMDEVSASYTNGVSSVDVANAAYDRSSRTLSLDSFSFHPVASRDSFNAANKYQRDYLTLGTGPVSAGPFDLDRFLKDTIADLGMLRIQDMQLESYRDKRLPYKPGPDKPMPVELLKMIPLPLSAEGLELKNASVTYTEINPKTNLAGTVTLHNMNGNVKHVRNYDWQPGDSLDINVGFDLQDAIPIRVALKAAYTDSLGGFMLNVNASIPDARKLNPVLEPLASVRLQSGTADTFALRATGNRVEAMGESYLPYHDLRIQVLNNKAGSRKKGLNRFASFFANAFVIKKNNRSGNGYVYFRRLPDRSPLHYLVKITTSGVGSSIGLKKGKTTRLYKKARQKRNP